MECFNVSILERYKLIKKKIKILFLVNILGFFNSHRLPIAKAALSKGFEVVIGYGELGVANPKHLEEIGFKVFYIPIDRKSLNPFKELKSFIGIWKFFRKEMPDIVHLIAIKPYLYGGIISRFIGIKYTISSISGLGSLFIKKNLVSNLYQLLIYPLYKYAFSNLNNIVIVQNNDDFNFLKNWGVIKKNKVRLIKGSGVDLENFKNFKEPKGEPVVCFCARLLRDKGIYEFISAAKQLHQQGVKARFIIAGDLDIKNPSSLNHYEHKRIKNDPNLEVIGYSKNIPKLFENSHIICLPSYREGLPKSLVEAAAASRAVVTTDVPGCRDAIIPDKTGLLVPSKNSERLAEAILFLLKNPSIRVEMGKSGRIFAEKEFAIKKIISKHLNIYEELKIN